MVLAFSGGGMRAAAFSYGVLETLRTTEVPAEGGHIRALDEVDVITAVSGGSFTALAYGLYGETLFDQFETRFLKRNVQGELIARFLTPFYWPALWSRGWGRSELAAQLYDDILFHGATYRDLEAHAGPLIVVSATDLSRGSRVLFLPTNFDILCSDLSAVPLSRAAAASSALPIVLSAVTLDNYGGTCGYEMPEALSRLATANELPRPAARINQRLDELEYYEETGRHPYIHLIDGGIADNLGLRAVLDVVLGFEALRSLDRPTPLDRLRRIVVFIVNAASFPQTDWDDSENAPGMIETLLKATGVPIDRYSYESVELLRDIAARWSLLRTIRRSPAFAGEKDPGLDRITRAPDLNLYIINVSLADLPDRAEFEYLNQLSTTLALPDEAVDRLRAAARTIIMGSPDFRRLLKDLAASQQN